jgi:hypothetical protein
VAKGEVPSTSLDEYPLPLSTEMNKRVSVVASKDAGDVRWQVETL